MYLSEQPSDAKDLDFDFTLDDLETVKVIGKGSGGVVQLVRHKWVGKLFALKVVIHSYFQSLITRFFYMIILSTCYRNLYECALHLIACFKFGIVFFL